MNWLKKISQSKPMALPTMVPEHQREQGGIAKIDRNMSEETAQNEYSLDPSMSLLGAGSNGIVYKSSGRVIKYSKDISEFRNTIFAFENQLKWVVPILEQPRQIQENPFLCKIAMKELDQITARQSSLLWHLTDHILPGKKIVELPDIGDVMDDFVLTMNVDEVFNIYSQVEYIIQENEKTFKLRDIHPDNFGWDGNKLKLLDLSR